MARLDKQHEGLYLWGMVVLRLCVEGASNCVHIGSWSDSSGVDTGSSVPSEALLQSGAFGAGDAEREYVAAIFESRETIFFNLQAGACAGVRSPLSEVPGGIGSEVAGKET